MPPKTPRCYILFYLGFERGLPLSRISRREMRLRRGPAGATGPGVLSKTGNHTRLPKSASKARKAPVRAQGSHKTPTECVLWDRGDTAQRRCLSAPAESEPTSERRSRKNHIVKVEKTILSSRKNHIVKFVGLSNILYNELVRR